VKVIIRKKFCKQYDEPIESIVTQIMGSSCSLQSLVCCNDDTTQQHPSVEAVYEPCPSLHGPPRSDVPYTLRGGSERSSVGGGHTPTAPTTLHPAVVHKPNLRVDLAETPSMAHSPVAHDNDGSSKNSHVMEVLQLNPPRASSPTLKLVYPQRHNPLAVGAAGSGNASGGGLVGMYFSSVPQPPSTTPTRSIASRYSATAKPPLSRQVSSLQSMHHEDRVTSSVTTINGNLFEWGGTMYGGGDDTLSSAQSHRATVFLPPTPSDDGRRSLVAFHVPRNSTPAVSSALPPVPSSTADADDIAATLHHAHQVDSGTWGVPNRSTTDSLQSDFQQRRSTAASSQWGGSYAAGSFEQNNALSLPTFRPA
jgi:hypothetical protein